MADNFRGYDPSELQFQIASVRDVWGEGHSADEDSSHYDPDYFPVPDGEFKHVDLVAVNIIYPDDHVERFVLAGPWNDYDHFYDRVYSWLEAGDS